MKNLFRALVPCFVVKLRNAPERRVLKSSVLIALFLTVATSSHARKVPNDPPTLTTIEGSGLNYTEDQGAVNITSTIVVSDLDNATLTQATIKIVANYVSSEDVLSFVDAFGITGAYNSANGTLTLSGNASVANYQAALRSVKYTNTNSAAPSTTARVVSFVVNDGTANSSAAVRSINVAVANDAPVLANIEGAALNYVEGDASTSITALLTVTDVDHTTLSGAVVKITSNYISTEDVLSFTNAAGITGSFDNTTGTMTLSGSATVANYQNAIRNVKYRNSNNNSPSELTRTVSFTVTDGALVSSAVNRSITVMSVNDAPAANADYFSTSTNTPVTANLKTNDTDAENNTITLNTTPVIQPQHGTVVVNSSGSFTYTPNGVFTGTETFTYEICDNGTEGGLPTPKCSHGVVTIIVNPINPKFNIVGNNAVQVSEQCFILTNELNNQQGAVWSRSTLDLRFSFELNFEVMLSDTGVVKDNGADGIIFALQRDVTPPPSNAAGSPLDARGATGEYLGIGGVSPSIGIEVDTYQNGGEPAEDHIAISRDGSVYNILSPAVAAKLDGSNNPVNIEDGVSHTVKIAWDKPTNTLQVYFDGVLRTTYTGDITNTIFGGDPTNIYWGFSASTGGSTNLHGVCGIGMDPINLPPTAVDDSPLTPEDTALNSSVLGNDSDPEGGTLKVTSETKATAHGTVTINQDGTYTYTPASNYNGSDSFTYTVCDNFATPGCSSATVNITISAVADNPVAVSDSYTLSEDIPYFALAADGLLKNDYDVDGGTLTVSLDENVAHGLLALSANGSFSYIPYANYNGTDQFKYHVTDGALNSTSVIVTLSITAVNDDPIAYDDVASVDEDNSVEINVLFNDEDVDNTIDITTVDVDDAGLDLGTVSVNATTGRITFTPHADLNGSDSFAYTVKDANGAISNSATISIQVNAVNDAPRPQADSPSVGQGEIEVDVLANDIDIDSDIDAQSIAIQDQPEHGEVNVVNGKVFYTPHDLAFGGGDSFSYTIKDVEGLESDKVFVAMLIEPSNLPPDAVDDGPIRFNTVSAITIDALENDTDPNGNQLTIIAVGAPDIGTAKVENNRIVYQPIPLTTSTTITFTYTVEDDGGLTDQAIITLEYQPLHVSQGFSPNGDGQNDWWFIQGVEHFPGNVLNVFDRWGLLVYSVRGYDNATTIWNGTANKGAVSGKIVDQGTYYYTLELGGEAKPVSGYVVIVK
ncbi:Ig-like domain-containing protein [Pseudochryseolinea flava]|uniref:Cadherin domain-containing protein n=1 Tax=Pseudochryseolinea flava TaxID=2059302 RepID=A0A364Y2G6_9BACT|nr:Ig-like domain-containing protein [Pseudochryseolinea flava]RAW00970.1 hypothetical protein DQQ10_12070 [Pseudochryseolinea flava]